jgi:hypothetical protein
MDDTSLDVLNVPCRFRADGLDLLVKQLILKDGFVGRALPLISIHEGEILLTVSMNIGLGSREREYFAFEIAVPVHELVKKYDALNLEVVKKEHDEIDAIGKEKIESTTMVSPGVFIASPKEEVKKNE